MLVAGFPSIVAGATLDGIVAEHGEPVAGVEVMLVDATSKVILGSLYTDRQGAFRFEVEPGTFNVGAFKAEYASAWSKGIAVKATDISVQIELIPEAFVDDSTPSSDDCE